MCLIALSFLFMYRPPELAYKYGNLSEGVCKPGYAAAKMTTIYPKYVRFVLHGFSHYSVEIKHQMLAGSFETCFKNFTYKTGSFTNKSF